MFGKKEIKVEQIGLDAERQYVVMKGIKKSLLADSEVYSIFQIPDNEVVQFSSLIGDGEDDNNNFIKDVLDLTGEKIKNTHTILLPDYEHSVASQLELSDEIIQPALFSTASIYTIIGGGNIFLDEKSVVKMKGKYEKRKFDAYKETIEFKDIESLNKNIKSSGIIADFDEQEYEKLDFAAFGVAGEMIAVPFLQIAIPVDTKPILTYAYDEKAFYSFFSPRDKEISSSVGQKYEKKIPVKGTYGNFSIMKKILDKNNYNVRAVFIDGEPLQPLGDNNILYKVLNTAIGLEKSGDIKTLRSSEEFGIGLSAIYSNNLWLRKDKMHPITISAER